MGLADPKMLDKVRRPDDVKDMTLFKNPLSNRHNLKLIDDYCFLVTTTRQQVQHVLRNLNYLYTKVGVCSTFEVDEYLVGHPELPLTKTDKCQDIMTALSEVYTEILYGSTRPTNNDYTNYESAYDEVDIIEDIIAEIMGLLEVGMVAQCKSWMRETHGKHPDAYECILSLWFDKIGIETIDDLWIKIEADFGV